MAHVKIPSPSALINTHVMHLLHTDAMMVHADNHSTNVLLQSLVHLAIYYVNLVHVLRHYLFVLLLNHVLMSKFDVLMAVVSTTSTSVHLKLLV